MLAVIGHILIAFEADPHIAAEDQRRIDDDINSILEEQNKRALEIKPKTSILRRVKCFLDKLFKNDRNSKIKAIKNEENSIDELNDLDCIIED